METRGEEVHVNVEEARAGSTPSVVRYVLLVSLTLAIVALSAFVLGAQSALGSTLQSLWVTPVVPLELVAAIAGAALALTALAAIAPMRFVLADSPVRAFARA